MLRTTEMKKEIEEAENQIMLRPDKYSHEWNELVIKKEKLQALLQQNQEIIKEIEKLGENSQRNGMIKFGFYEVSNNQFFAIFDKIKQSITGETK